MVVLCSLAACGRLGFENQPDRSPAPDAAADAGGDAIARPVAPTNGLVAYWPFDAIANKTSVDVVGGNDAACSSTTGCPDPITGGALGGALGFDGAKACLDVAGLTSWSSPTFTISAWVQSSAMSGPVVVHESSSGCPSPELELNQGAGLVQLNTTDSTPHNEAWTTAAIANPSAWHDVAVAWDGSVQSVYVDGVCSCSLMQSLGPLDHAQPFTIGCYPTGGPTFFTGAIDEVRVYDRVLGAQEIADLVGSVTGTSPVPAACAVKCATVAP